MGGKCQCEVYQTCAICRDEPVIRKRHGSPVFYSLLKEMEETHDKKSHDYASNKDPYGNYKFAGLVSSLFAHSPDDAGFVGRIAEKIFRLANLESSGKQAKSESIEDTERDIAVIACLWMASRREKRQPKINETDSFKMVNVIPRLCSGCNEVIAKSDNTVFVHSLNRYYHTSCYDARKA